ncbi:MAG TPA: DUF4255 domain-containing protein [Longimicrobium sp.]|jgi:hypothetical protein|nr:DUF4255 domain-containing protein [Longimicrobium sp.]
MSNALAVAAVSAVLRDLLDSGMIEHSVTDAVGQGVTVSAVAPDTIELTGPKAKPRLNLFLYQVTANAALRNAGLPARDGSGARTGEVPLALDLHYLVTAYGTDDFQAEVLLGYAMQLLHETPVLARGDIRKALAPAGPVSAGLLPGVYKALRAADLADQVEQIKVTPATLNPEEMSRLWSALQAHYRPTAPYQVSVVLIESRRSARSAPPVLSRGPVDPVSGRERGIVAEPGLLPPLPAIDAVQPPDGQPAARLGDTVEVRGHHLDGVTREVLLSSARLQVRVTVAALAGGGHGLLRFTVPSTPATLPAGVYRLTALVKRAGEPQPRATNELVLVVAPEITTALPLTRMTAAMAAGLTLDCRPHVRPGQRASLILGEREAVAEPFTAIAPKLTFRFPDLAPGSYLARLRVDGIESLVIDRSAVPPKFFDHVVKVV